MKSQYMVLGLDGMAKKILTIFFVHINNYQYVTYIYNIQVKVESYMNTTQGLLWF